MLPTPTSDVVCSRSVTVCQSNSPFVLQRPSLTSDRECRAQCPGIPARLAHVNGPIGTSCACAGQYIVQEETATSSRKCAAACSSNQYLTPTTSSKDVLILGLCLNVEPCSEATPFQIAAPTQTTNRKCTSQCGSDEYVVNNICTAVRNCDSRESGLFQRTRPTVSSDRTCVNECQMSYEYIAPAVPPNSSEGICTALSNCTLNSPFQLLPPSQTSNRVCTSRCTSTQYLAPSPNVNTCLGVCTNVTVCAPNTQSTPPTTTTDRTCVVSASEFHLNHDAIIGIVIGVLLMTALCTFGSVFVWRRYRTASVKMTEQSVELVALVSKDAQKEAVVQRMLAAWQIPSSHLTFVRRLASGTYTL